MAALVDGHVGWVFIVELNACAGSEQEDKPGPVVPGQAAGCQVERVESVLRWRFAGLGLKGDADRGLADQVPVDAVVPAAVPPGRRPADPPQPPGAGHAR